MSPRLVALLALLFLPGAGVADRAGEEPRDESFEGDASVVVVEVPVTVTRSGEPVRGLTADDFLLFDRGEPQEIVAFEVLESGAYRTADGEEPGEGVGATETGSGESTPPHANRHFLFQYDLAYAGTGPLGASVEAARELLARTLSPGDRVGVVFFSALRGMTWVIGLTDDRADASRALAVMEALLASDEDAAAALLDGWDPDPASVVPADALPDHEAILAEAGLSSLQRNDPSWPHVSTFTLLARGMRRIADGTRSLPGRKHLVQLSTGIPDRLLHDPTLGRPRVLGEIQEILQRFRRTGWTIQSVNLAGLGWGRDSLFVLAEDTGGRLYTNSNDVALLVEEMERSTRVTYLLAFQPDDLEPDGNFHSLKVRLKDRRRGTRVTQRPGYYAPDGP